MYRNWLVAVLPLFATSALADPGRGIVVDSRGNVYVGDVVRNVIWKIAPHEAPARFAEGIHAHWLAIDRADNIYAEHLRYDPSSEKFYQSLMKLTPDGSQQTLIEPTSDPQVFSAISFLVDAEVNVYFFQQRANRPGTIFKRTPDGQVESYSDSTDSLRRASGMGWDSQGSLVFIDWTSVKKVARDGTVTTLISGESLQKQAEPSGPPIEPLWGLCVDKNDNVYVVDTGNRRVMRIAKNGQSKTVYRAGRPWSPNGVFARDGNLYILEHGSTLLEPVIGPRVRRIAADGSEVVLATIESK